MLLAVLLVNGLVSGRLYQGKYSRKATKSKTLSNWFDVDLVPVDPSFILSLNVMKCLERRKWWKECAD